MLIILYLSSIITFFHPYVLLIKPTKGFQRCGSCLFLCLLSQAVGGFALTCLDSPAEPWWVTRGEEMSNGLKVSSPSLLLSIYSYFLPFHLLKDVSG